MTVRRPELRIFGATATALVGQNFRLLHRLTPVRIVPFPSFCAALAVLSAAAIGLLLIQGVQTGQSLASGSTGFLSSLTGVLFAAGSMSGLALILCRDLWSRHIRAETERLAFLPIGRRSLATLALIPSLLPPLVGMAIGALAIASLCAGMGRSPVTPLTGFALGVALSLAVGLSWSLLLKLGRIDRLSSGVLAALCVVGLFVHAGWTIISQGGEPDMPHGLSPVVMALGRVDPFTWVHFSVAIAIVCGLARLLVEADLTRPAKTRLSAVRHPRVRRSGLWLPQPCRVPWQVCLTVARQSRARSELGLTVVLCGLAAWVSGRMEVVGRPEAAVSAVLIVAAFTALPTLGLRSGLGPTYRLWLLGARRVDVFAGLVAAGMAFQGAGVLTALMVLFLLSTSTGLWVMLLVWAGLNFGVSTIVANGLRGIAYSSIGRTVATALLLLPTIAVLSTGLTLSAPMPVLAISGLCVALGLWYLWASLSGRVVE